jgi:hypothetical protein
MGDGEVRRIDNFMVVKENVDVDGTRPFREVPHTTCVPLYRKACFEQLLRFEIRVGFDNRVQKPWLVE